MQSLLSILILPFTLTVIVMLAGVLLYRKSRFRMTGMVLIAAGAVLLLFFSSRVGSYTVLSPLETRYDPLLAPESVPVPVEWVVVLGGGYNQDGFLSATARLSQSSTRRLTEGIRIIRRLPDATLIVSGGVPRPVANEDNTGEVTGRSYESTAEMMYRVMADIGVDTSGVIRHTGPENTEQEARTVVGRVADRVGNGPVSLLSDCR